MQIRKKETTDMIREQLTLRAVIWDVREADTERLDRELNVYHVVKLSVAQETYIRCGRVQSDGLTEKEKTVNGQETPAEQDAGHSDTAGKCRLFSHMLTQVQILEKDALLVTEDAELVEYIQQRHTGLAVVYYEKQESKTDVSADYIVQGFEETGVQFFDRIQKRKNGLPWNILYTARTCVREITLSDLDELFELYRGKGITDYTEPLYERQKEEEYIKSYINCMYYYYGYGMWVIRDRATGRLLGRVGIEHRDMGERVLMELGYIIGADDQNRGYATEVCRAVMEYASQQLFIDELHCFIHPQNCPSLRVAEKLGFELAEETCGQTEEMCGQTEETCGQTEELLHFRKLL